MSSKKTIVEHIHSIKRYCIINCVVWILTFSALWYVREDILSFLLQLGNDGLVEPQALNPTSPFLVLFKIIAIASSVVNTPLWILTIWKYLQDEMTYREKKWFIILVVSITVLSIFGVVYTWWLVVPVIINFFMSVTPEYITLQYNIAEYVDFILFLLLISILIFQLPILIVSAALVQIVSAKQLAKKRKIIYFSMVVLSAFITPADALSIFLVAIPLIILFELSLLFIHLFLSQKSS